MSQSPSRCEFFAPKGIAYDLCNNAAEIERLVEAGQLDSALLPFAQSVSIMEGLDAVRKRIGLRYPVEC